MIDFLELALKRGVSRFVLLSASLLPAGGPAMGQVHLWLEQNAAQWAVLRPSWFMENFSEGHHLRSLREERRIYSATESGRVPFISAEDIAAVAQAALTRENSFNLDFVLTGGEPISYDEVARSIGGAIGRAVSHTIESAQTNWPRAIARWACRRCMRKRWRPWMQQSLRERKIVLPIASNN
jgi:nucleoside-diphosphate-sugar epimerase